MSRIRRFVCTAVGIVALVFTTGNAHAQTITFDQLDWQGISSSTTDSSWGRATIDFVGFSSTQYFNLNIGGNWVIQNMGVDSLFGTGVNQTVSTMFDLGVAAGTDVATLDYGFAFSNTPDLVAPVVSTFGESVASTSYQIGGEGGVDLGGGGSKDAPATQDGDNPATITMSAKLPNINQMPNQVQGENECAPGAVSNSIMYLINTGKIPATTTNSLSDLKTALGTTATGTPASWYQTKKTFYDGVLDTEYLEPTDLMDLIDAVNAGKDVEVDLKGHVAVVVGVRKFSDGRVELDIYDDNQTDTESDPVRTVQIIDGKIGGMELERFVVESIPTPAALPAGLISLGAMALRRRRRVARVINPTP